MPIGDLPEVRDVGPGVARDAGRLARPGLLQERKGIHIDNSLMLLFGNNKSLVRAGSKLLLNRPMNNKAIRRANLIALIETEGEIQRLAGRFGMNASYMSQIKNGTRQMGDSFARRIEKALGKPEGWMDIPQFRSPDAQMDAAEALQILSTLSDDDRDAWLKHGRLLVESGARSPANPFGPVKKGGNHGGSGTN